MSGGTTFSVLIGPGQSINLPCAGTQFYVVACPGQVWIDYGQGSSPYSQGTGAQSGAPISLLRIRNPASNQTVVQVYVGYDDYVDKRLVPLSYQPGVVIVQNPNFVASDGNPPNPNYCNFDDLSGTIQTSLTDGFKYFLVARLNLIVSNISNLVLAGGQTSGMAIDVGAGKYNAQTTQSIAQIPSLTVGSLVGAAAIAPVFLSFKGAFCIVFPAIPIGSTGFFQFSASEIYQGIPAPS
jgi:hypothetical protein